jgi:hypothetical protein
VSAAIDAITLEGFPALSTITRIHDDLIADDSIDDAKKAQICEHIANADKHLVDSADDELQLQDAAAHILKTLS